MVSRRPLWMEPQPQWQSRICSSLSRNWPGMVKVSHFIAQVWIWIESDIYTQNRHYFIVKRLKNAFSLDLLLQLFRQTRCLKWFIKSVIEHEHKRSMSTPTATERKQGKDIDHLLPSRLRAPALLAPPKVWLLVHFILLLLIFLVV